jgi:hypothetical protein
MAKVTSINGTGGDSDVDAFYRSRGAEFPAEGLLDHATCFEAYKTVVEHILREVAASKRAVAAARNEAEVETKLIDILSGKEGSAAGDDPKSMSDDEIKKRLGIQ